ncbi:TFIIB-type zinc ribbon-containing protein [Natrinema salsiterrestre]|uniref:TFIIB-type zinc ribbon-containing protein n=1 Tax=Natrinema salsiterrestre TaxID=2950540 RepID=A0A9Q4KY40_9EURY|nr:TFIIB-type zinc ribbon-containing protein [Natrinema salsiterrestre]MDF9745930.1 TFIIB-type zinc ribbon-containing protein [Natrinema salsiterrestre]
MAARDVYTTAFDENVQTTTTACPDCGGSVRQADRETTCEDCGLVLEENQLDRGPIGDGVTGRYRRNGLAHH